MAVRETFELDVRAALGSITQLDRALSGAAAKFKTALAESTTQLTPAASSGITTVTRQIDEAAEAQKKAALAAKQHDETLRRLGTNAGVAGAAIAAGLGIAFRSAALFAKEISTVGAVSDATAKQLGRLEDAAIEAGAATVFSAQEAAQAEAELAKAGISISDILGGALRGSLDLAAAGQLELARAAEIAAQSMQIFGLQGKDVTHIADVLAAGANKSTASVESLGQGLGNAGGAARLAGLSLEETVGVLALLDQNAVRGAEGGTALRSALLALFTPSKIQREELDKLGLSVFDTSGKFIGLERLAGELQTRLGGLTDAQRNASLGIIFGSFGIQAATALYKEGAIGVKEYIDAVNDQGAASRFASRQLDNLAGDVEQLSGSLETTFIRSGSQANGVLRFLAQGATGLVNSFGGLPGPLQAVGVGIATVTAAGLLAFAAFTRLEPAINRAKLALAGMSPASRLAATGLARVAGVVTGLVVGAASFDAIGTSAAGTVTGLLGMAAAGASVGAAFGHPAIGAAAGIMVGIGKAVFAAGESTEEFRKRIEGLASELDELGEGAATTKFLDQVEGLADIGASLDRGRTVLNIANIRREIRQLATENPAAAAKVIAGFRGMATAGELTEKQLLQLERAVNTGTSAYARHKKNAEEAATANKNVAESAGLVDVAARLAAEAQAGYTKTLVDSLPTVLDFFDQAIDAVEDFTAANAPDKLLEQFNAQLAGMDKWTKEIQRLLDLGLTDLAKLVFQKGPIAGGALVNAFENANPGVLAALNTTAGTIDARLAGITGQLNNTWGPAFYGAGFSLGQNAGAGLAAGFTAGPLLNEIADIEARVRNALESQSPSKVFVRIGQSIGQGLALGMETTENLVDQAGRRLTLRAVTSSPVASGLRSATGGGTGGAISNTAVHNNSTQIVVQAPMPNPAAVGLETARVLRREQFLKGR